MDLKTFQDKIASFGSSEFVIYYGRNRFAVVCADFSSSYYIEERNKPLPKSSEMEVKLWSWTHNRPILVDSRTVRKVAPFKL